MNGREMGFLLLTSSLGNPDRKPLTLAQLRTLNHRVRQAERIDQLRDVTPQDLLQLGYDPANARRIVDLLEQEEQLSWYVAEGKRYGCVPVTRVSESYPVRLRSRMGLDAPGCLWAKGDLSLLDLPAVSLVGSRELRPLNEAFAAEVGRQAALQGYVLVSGNAKGADSVAQDSALAHGGKVISVVADQLQAQPDQENVLYLSEMDFDAHFSAARALSRNRTIHALGGLTLVAQCTLGKGGSWDGSVKNLKYGYSPLFVLDDGSEGAEALIQMGAEPILGSQLENLSTLKPFTKSLIDR